MNGIDPFLKNSPDFRSEAIFTVIGRNPEKYRLRLIYWNLLLHRLTEAFNRYVESISVFGYVYVLLWIFIKMRWS